MTLLAEDQLEPLLDKLSGYAKPDERITVLARYHHLKPEALERRPPAGRSCSLNL